MKLVDLARILGAELVPAPGSTAAEAEATVVSGVAPVAGAGPGLLTFVAAEEFAHHLESSQAAAAIVGRRFPAARLALLVHANPYWAFAQAAQRFHPPKAETPGRHPSAVVAPTAHVAATATLYPLCYVGAGARIGERVALYPGVYVGDGAEVGDDTVLRANVVVEARVRIGARVLVHGGTVVGADGFGFAPGPDGLAKIPQIGTVVIGDDVEVGGCVSIDRGALDDTRVGDGTKLDSHVHVGHGAQLGRHCMMCGLSGLAGSVKLGDGVVIAGHAAVDSRVEIASGVQVGALSGVTKDLPVKGIYLGFPAIPAGEWRRQLARVRRLALLEERVRTLEAKLAAALALPPA